MADRDLTPEVAEAGERQHGGRIPRAAAGLEPDAGRRRVGGAGVAGRVSAGAAPASASSSPISRR